VSIEETTLGQVVARTGGALQTGPFGSQLHASDYTTFGTPLIMPVNLGDNEIREDGIARIGVKDAKRLRRHALREDDIVFSRRGDVGRRSIVRAEQSGWLCGTGCLAARFGSKLDEVNPSYVALYVGSKFAQTWLVDNAVGGTMPNLNTGILSALPVQLPPRGAQDRIVEAIDDAHTVALDLERQIAKKQAIKQGMMQQLLLGRIRLGGFVGEWGRVQLGDAVEFLDSQRRPVRIGDRARMRGSIPYYGASGVVDHIDKYLFDEDLILLGEDGENIVSRVVPLAFRISGRAWVNNHAHVLRPKSDFDIGFLTAYLESLDYSGLNTGTAQPKLNKQSCLAIQVAKPPTSEQVAIANVLRDADQELGALRARIEKAQVIKQGMLQQLLTGRTRLPVQEAMA
jgi:type I restriction enzyme, S subunit